MGEGYTPTGVTLSWQEWYIWRPVKAQWATLQEIETHWSIVDLANCHQLLDIEQEADDFESKKLKREMSKVKRGK